MAVKTYLNNARKISLLLVVLTFSTTAHPKTIHVDDDGSADLNNIQAAINDSSHGDTIIVAEGRYFENINFNGKNITLRSTDPDDPGVVAATIIDGVQNGSVVTFNSGEDANCVLNGFTITNGYAENGGGIYCGWALDPPLPPLPPPSAGLVGVQSSQGDLSEPNFSTPRITNCIISGNLGEYGGGMCSYYGKPELNNCTFRGNSADYGGGMCMAESNPTLVKCTFSQNFSNYGGGLLNSAHSDTMLTDCTFNDNSAVVGGGFYNHLQSTITLTDCTLYNNLADDTGGGAYNSMSISTMTGCTFNDNNSIYEGGGLYNDQSTLTLTKCNFFGNSASLGGGGMYNIQSTLSLTNCIFTDNFAMADYKRIYGSGGAIHNRYSSLNLTNCAFSENSASLGGGGMFNFHSSPTVASCAFSKNSAIFGGGMDNNYSTPILTNCIFTANSANSSGAGIYISNSSLTLNNCTVTGNLAEYNGGGIYSFGNDLTVNNCILWGNEAEDGPQINLRDNSIAYVQYTNLQGGPGNVYIDPDAELNWGRGNIDADPCFVRPGYSKPPTPLFKASEPNPPDGSIGVSLIPYLTWTPGHNAVSHDVYFGTANPPPFIGNQTAATFVPGTMDYETTYYWRIDEVSGSTVTTGDIWNFTTYPFPQPPPPSPPLYASYVGDNWQYNLKEPDYHLLPGSPCINAGDPNYIAAPNETDLDGYMRVVDGRIDMGAYEYAKPIQAEVSIIPNTINPESKGSWITCYIRLPQGSNVADIDPDTVFLEDQIQPEQFSVDEHKQVVTVRFRREDVQAILDIGEIELTITGRLTDLNHFEGTVVIKVINKASGKTDKYEQASNPDPPDGAIEVSRTADLSWTPSSSATSRDVYFGTTNPPTFIDNQTATTFDPGKMAYETIYFWRIDEINKWGTTTGDIWHFTTVPFPPPPPPPPPPP
ncbi:MAG: hypothetical protein GWN61_14975 [candidate division Zixibacteria bacterium]|nr:hypothetical protein [Phycisphaerae bacterium]NIR65537.1 hypothetical protein [candidate division Zixibacteria bacterium]NIW46618.1 hypothetical protein [Gammaproteobacteria bacterium]NIP54970.1 hypothetical protein [Phycisphaerae bacterium]NIS53696.1 hypothetical protein [Phycisphaerae bacterium]